MNKTRKYFLLFIAFLVVILVLFLYIRHINSQQKITVQFKNVSDIKIKEDYVANKTPRNTQVVLDGIENNKTHTLFKGNYIISYIPDDGYERKDIYVSLFDKERYIHIDPYFTEEKLDSVRKSEFRKIKTTLQQKLSAVEKNYTIYPGKLYGRGEWYGTTLQYMGNNPETADTLKVIMKKQNNNWNIITQPPSISFSKYHYKNIPQYILDDVNNVQNTPLIEKYLNPDTSH